VAFKLEWKPVLQALALKDYHLEYEDNVIQVCVNPQPDFLQERTALMVENSSLLMRVQRATQNIAQAKGDDLEAATQAAREARDSFNTWIQQGFLPGIQNWFARLWSFGNETFTAEDLDEYEKVDPHFLNWLKRRSMEMIDEHQAGRKKA